MAISIPTNHRTLMIGYEEWREGRKVKQDRSFHNRRRSVRKALSWIAFWLRSSADDDRGKKPYIARARARCTY